MDAELSRPRRGTPSSPILLLLWTLLAVFMLAADYASGPYIHFPILYLFPIGLTAWHNGRNLAFVMVGIMSLGHLALTYIWATPETDTIVNEVTHTVVLGIVALLVARVASQERALRQEVQTLRGFLPICSACKKIRGQDDQWQQLEHYISEHSGAKFTHSLCPDCAAAAIAEIERGHALRRKDDVR